MHYNMHSCIEVQKNTNMKSAHLHHDVVVINHTIGNLDVAILDQLLQHHAEGANQSEKGIKRLVDVHVCTIKI